MHIDQPAFDATTFSKNRQRLLEHAVADEFFEVVVRLAGEAPPICVVGAFSAWTANGMLGPSCWAR